jgi:hypothetical protein
MRVELILIAIVALAASLSAYAQDIEQGAGENVTAQRGYQEGLCTVAQNKI